MYPAPILPSSRGNHPWEIYLGVAVGCLMASWVAIASYGWALFAYPIMVLIVLVPCVLIYLVRFFMKRANQSRVASRKEKIRVFKIFLLIVWPICIVLPGLYYWIPFRIQMWSVPTYDGWTKTKSEVVLFGWDGGRYCGVTITGYTNNPKMVFRYYEHWLVESNGYDRVTHNSNQDFVQASRGGGDCQHVSYLYSKKGRGARLVMKYPVVPPYTGNRVEIDPQRKSELKIQFY